MGDKACRVAFVCMLDCSRIVAYVQHVWAECVLPFLSHRPVSRIHQACRHLQQHVGGTLCCCDPVLVRLTCVGMHFLLACMQVG